MVFTPQHYSDFIRLLKEHPEWRQELRRLLLPDVEELSRAIQALTQAQLRTEEGLERLAEAQRRTEERLERLEATVASLAEAQRRTEERLERVEAAIERLIEILTDHTVAIGDLKGRMLELDYQRKAGAYFGPLLRRTRVYEHHVLADELEPHLSPGELRDALLIDVVIRGLPRIRPELPEVLLAVEVSSVVDREDVNRARRRAALLSTAGYPVIPVVAGEEVTLGAEDEIRHHRVVLLQDGRVSQWEEALEALSTPKNAEN